MTIKGAWVYRVSPSYEDVYSSLRQLLKYYPQLLGHYDDAQKALVWDDGRTDTIAFARLDRREHSTDEDIYKLVPKYDVKGFKKGTVQPFSAYLLQLKDGAALVVQCAHAAMDGASFYTFVNQWAALTRGESISPMVTDQSLLPAPDSLSREQVTEAVIARHWVRMKFKHLLKMLIHLRASQNAKDTYVLEVSQEEIARMREESCAGTNAVLTSLAVRKLLEHLPAREEVGLLTVADFRGRACGVPKLFMGNFSQPVVTGPFSCNVPALSVQAALKKALDTDALTEQIGLTTASSHYGLPYFFFDASEMNCPKPKLFYINNQLKFRACETDFGTGLPLCVLQNELPDMIKFWQPVSGGPVQIIYGVFAARAMKKGRHG